jgi:hypothetical protein
MKRLSFRVVLVLVVYGILEVASLAGLWLIRGARNIEYAPIAELRSGQREILGRFVRGESEYTAYSASLGWTVAPGGARGPYRTNAAGVRSDREYARERPDGVTRVLTFGDSFVHGDEVGNQYTWQAAMEGVSGDLEVLNFGVGGYGLDQAFLRYGEDGAAYEADIVLIGFMSENIFRSVNTFRPSYLPRTALPLGKPRFVVSDGGLERIPNPLPTLADYERLLGGDTQVFEEIEAEDFYFRRHYTRSPLDASPTLRLAKVLWSEWVGRTLHAEIIRNGQYVRDSEAYETTLAIFDAFHAAVRDAGQRPVIVLFPHQADINQFRNEGRTAYAPLLLDLQGRGYRVIDLMNVLEDEDVSDIFDGRFHYGPIGNETVARYLLEQLADEIS